MPIPDRATMNAASEAWVQLRASLEESLNNLEKEIDDAGQVQNACTDEWCKAVEHALDDYANFLFALHEPRWVSDEESRKIKDLKKRVHDLYAQYKNTSGR
jgi:hypothetical protein